jgi:threonine dehydrogenase-like Zn-dependent dehydrogenase
MSQRFGANVVINPKEQDPVAAIMALTGNEGVDVAVEAVGTQATFEACCQVVRRGGTISVVGVFGLATPQVSMPTLSPSSFTGAWSPGPARQLDHLVALMQHRRST